MALFKDILIQNLDGGLFSVREENKIPDSYSPDLQNVEFDSGGSVQTRSGSAPFGEKVSALSGIRSLHTFKRTDGMEIPMRTWSVSAEYYNRQTSAWAILSGGFTADKIFGFADYAGFTYFGNDTNALFRWNGQYGKITNTHASSATVVEVTAEGGTLGNWLSAGEGIIGTMAIYYGSRTSGTLSAITGISAAITAGAEVAQAAVSARGFGSVSSIPRGNVLLINKDRLFLAGTSSEGSRCYFSKLGDPSDFTAASPSVDNDGGYVTVAEGGSYITSLAGLDNSGVVIFKKDAIKNFQFVALDNTRKDFPKLSDIADSRNSGSLSHRGTANIDNAIYFVSPIGGVRNVGIDTNTTMNNITERIRPTVETLSFVSASAIYHRNKYYLACRTSGATNNNTVLVFDRFANQGRGAWSRYNGWAVNQWTDFDGDLYFAAANEKTVYKALVNYDDDGAAYNAYWKSPLIDHEIPHERKRLRYIYTEGYISQSTVLSATVYYDALSASSKQLVIYGTGAYVDPSNTTTFGETVFGDGSFIGDPSGASIVLNKFRVRLSYSITDLFNYQLEFKSNGAGMAWRIGYIAPYVERMKSDIFPISSVIGVDS